MIKPKYLQSRDVVAIVSTARKITLEEIKLAIKLLRSWGLRVLVGKTIGLEDHQFAGRDLDRITDFQTALDNPDVKAIWCARGGYGTVRIIDQLDFRQFQRAPKWIIGYSDITILHNQVHRIGVETIHASMPLDIKKNTPEAMMSLRDCLFRGQIRYRIKSSEENKTGSAKGLLVGGNLSLLYSVLGSKSTIDTEGKILFIEDLDEYIYHIERMLINLRRNGYFDQLKGLIVGSFTDIHDNFIPFGKNFKEVILDCVSEYDFPVVFDFPAGHLRDNRALILGRNAQLDVGRMATALAFDEN